MQVYKRQGSPIFKGNEQKLPEPDKLVSQNFSYVPNPGPFCKQK